MAKDETLFTRRTEQEIDEALAWLENISSEDETKPQQTTPQKKKPSAYDVLPTWLKMDLHLETSENPPVDAPKAKDDNLSWLDSIATGLGGPLEEPPTMSWEETAIYQVSDEEREQALSEAANVVEDKLDDESIDAAMTGAAMEASQEIVVSETTEIWLPSDESLESAIRNLDKDDADLRREMARDFEGLDNEGIVDDLAIASSDDEPASFLQQASDLTEDSVNYEPDSDTLQGLLDQAIEDETSSYDAEYMPPINLEDDSGTDFPTLTPPEFREYSDDILNPIEEDVTSLIEPEVGLEAEDLDFDSPFDGRVQEETQILLAEDELETELPNAELEQTMEALSITDDVDKIIAEVDDGAPAEKRPILGDASDLALQEDFAVDKQEDVTQIYVPDDPEPSGYFEQVSAEIAAERADFEQYVSDIEARTEINTPVDSTEAITQIFLPQTQDDDVSAESTPPEADAAEVTEIYLPQSAEPAANVEELTEIYLPDLLNQAAEQSPASIDVDDVTEIHLPSHEEQESAYLEAVDADATEIYLQADEALDSQAPSAEFQPEYDDEIPAPVNFNEADTAAENSGAVPADLAIEPTIISQLPISARWNSLLENAASLTEDELGQMDEAEKAASPIEASPAQATNIASEIPEDPDEAMAWLEAMVRKQQDGDLPALPSSPQNEDQNSSLLGNAAEPVENDVTEIYPAHAVEEIDETLEAIAEGWEEVDSTADTQVAPAVEHYLVDDPFQFGLEDVAKGEALAIDPLTDTDEIPSVTDEMLTELAELEKSFADADSVDETDPTAETQISPAATMEQVTDFERLGLTEADIEEIKLPAMIDDVDASPPTPPLVESADDELNDALAWLKNVAEGSDTSLDEMTVELDQEDVAKLLEEHLAKTAKPPADDLLSDATPSLYLDSNASETHKEDELELSEDELRQDNAAATYEDGPTLITEMPQLEEGLQIDEPTQIERFGDSDELDEALAWLEAFTNDEPTIDPKGNLAAEAYADSFSDDTIAPAYESERVLAHKAFKQTDYAAVARAYNAVLAQGDPLGADLVVRDVKEWIKTASDQPHLFRLLGEGHLQLKQYELSALAYRRALELL